jgi:hypothetical protein
MINCVSWVPIISDCFRVFGAQIKDKIGVILNLLDVVDALYIGGGMAYTFKKEWQGMKIGKSLYDKDGVASLPKILEKARAKGMRFEPHIIAHSPASCEIVGRRSWFQLNLTRLGFVCVCRRAHLLPDRSRRWQGIQG